MKRDLNPQLYDARMIETHVRDGLLSREQVKSFLGALPDESEHCEKIKIDDETLSGNAGYSAESTDDTSDY